MDQLQGAVEQLQEDGCNDMTGSFHNPAHNCSHIAQNNPNATSGTCMIVCAYQKYYHSLCQSSQVTTGCRVVQAMQYRCTVIWRGCVGVMKGGGEEEGG